MAVNPITQPLAPGLTSADYSPWSPEGQARSATPGILNYTPGATPPLDIPDPWAGYPTSDPQGRRMPPNLYSPFVGGNPYGNYVRNYPEVMAAFESEANEKTNIADFGKHHWEGMGGPHLENRILPSSTYNDPWNSIYGVSSAVYLGDIMDTHPSTTSPIGASGLPQPDVEGYKYEYPIYAWGGNDDPRYSYVGSNTADIDEYPYYPYMPEGGEAARSRNSRILIGHRLVPV